MTTLCERVPARHFWRRGKVGIDEAVALGLEPGATA
jgi:hypothetical protein